MYVLREAYSLCIAALSVTLCLAATATVQGVTLIGVFFSLGRTYSD